MHFDRRAWDVVVAGAGPAGLAATGALAATGLRVLCLADDPDAPWTNTFGVWAAELDAAWAALGLPGTAADVLAVRWPAVTVAGTRTHVLDRSYAVVVNDGLQRALRTWAEAAGAAVEQGRAAGVDHGPGGSSLVTTAGRVVDTRLVVDATGHRPALLQRRWGAGAVAWQAAYGIVGRFATPPITPGTAVLMDWSAGADDLTDPRFLYALHLGDDRYLVEETSLARRTAFPVEELAAFLGDRLARLGTPVTEVLATERVLIPMGGPLPSPFQRVIGIGAAGGQIHPATGYSVTAGLLAAARLGPALADALSVRRATPLAAAAAGWRAVWPATRRRARRYEDFGLRRLAGFTQGESRAFFDAFFSLPAPAWTGYLAGTLSPAAVRGLMRDVFAASPFPVQRALALG